MHSLAFLLTALLSLAPVSWPFHRPSEERVAPLGSDELEAQHGRILRAVGRGALEAGVQQLKALRAGAVPPELAAQLDKDLSRCEALIALRSRHLEGLVAKGSRVTLERAQGKLVATVTAFENGRLKLTGAKNVPPEIAADELLLAPLVKSLSAETLAGADPSVRGYAYVLAGDEKSLASVKGTPPADALRREADAFYKPVLELGEAAEQLEAIAGLGSPKDAEAARTLIAAVELLAAKHKALPIVTRRRAALLKLAAEAYEFLFDETKMLDGLSANVQKLPDGRVRLTYDFAKAKSISDFSANHTYHEDIRKSLIVDRAPARDLVIQKGFLRVGGEAVWRHALEFTGPITIRYGYTLDTAPAPGFFFSVNDDAAGSFVMIHESRALHVRHLPTRLDKFSPTPPVPNVVMMKVITTTFTVADGTAFAIESGKELSRLEAGPRNSGGLYLCVVGVTDLLFSEIVIESRVDAPAMRRQFGTKSAAALGL